MADVPYDPKTHGPIQTAPPAPPTGGGEQTYDPAKHGAIQKEGQRLEYPDAPTTAQIELPGLVKLPGLVGRLTGLDKDTMSTEAKAATLFGTLTTDNPRARQEIYVKHLPGAEKHDDKYGNPMIRYKGKLYYTSRPGEFDAMDAGRVALATAAAVPTMAAAPAGLPAAMAVGGITGVGMSLAEDAATRAAG